MLISKKIEKNIICLNEIYYVNLNSYYKLLFSLYE